MIGRLSHKRRAAQCRGGGAATNAGRRAGGRWHGASVGPPHPACADEPVVVTSGLLAAIRTGLSPRPADP